MPLPHTTVYYDFQIVILTLSELGRLDEALLQEIGRFYTAQGMVPGDEPLLFTKAGESAAQIVVKTLTTDGHLNALAHDLPGYEERIEDIEALALMTAFAQILEDWREQPEGSD